MKPPMLYRQFASQAEIDAEYNPAARLSDPGAYQRHYVEQSRLARERLPGLQGVPFGPTLAETLDIFPAAPSDAPVFVFIHGGYWRAFLAGDFSCVALGLHALGITTVVVNYALAPWVGIDEITRQTRAALAWVLRNIERHGGDPARVAVGGHSAGAHLAAMALQTRWSDDYGLPEDPFRAAVLVSGLYDLEPLRHSYLQPQIQLDDGVIRRNSPLFSIRACPTPVLLTWGGEESAEFVRQSTTFHSAWTDAGNLSLCAPQPGANHYSAIIGFEQSASAMCEWLESQLGPQRPADRSLEAC
ncbi:alpha/beta hydrolase [Variovorax sp. J31P179]|uniref:alpha/beta hydrolase n=1 Tax=Variovorax sp. J31P179 TaxID=3053508 RepID=UPI00257595EA|nr:alpha/beta hydrolase [Variovorax sp. J31P179]MDM0085517.1 alpha/beta hydrolase [Variovorax sp. J31P179]